MASIRLHPLAIVLLFVILARLTDNRWPTPIATLPAIRWIGVALLVAGVSSILLAYSTLLRAGTPIDPLKPTTRIVSGGIYAYSRNSVYLGLCLLFGGWGLQESSLNTSATRAGSGNGCDDSIGALMETIGMADDV